MSANRWRDAYKAAGRCLYCTGRPEPDRKACARHLDANAANANERRAARHALGQCSNCDRPQWRAKLCQLHWHLHQVSMAATKSWRGKIIHRIVGRSLRAIARAIFEEPDTRLADLARRFGVAPSIVSQIRQMARLPPREKRGPERRDAVTERARRIRELVASGMTHAQVAAHLGIPLNTLRKTLAARRADPWYPRPTSFFQE